MKKDSASDQTKDRQSDQVEDRLLDQVEDSPSDSTLELHETMFPLPKNYKFESFLGEGSFGQVIRCFKKDTKETVAVKVLQKCYETITHNELTVLLRLKLKNLDKCNFVKLIEKFKLKDHRTALAFEMLDITLCDYIDYHKKSKPLDLHEVQAVVQQMATALNALKSTELIHLDIKSDNIMVVDREAKPIRVKLIDFGLALSTHAAEQGSIFQLLSYRAPEIHLGLPFSEAIDMWSLGIIMGLMLTAQELNPGETAYDAMHYIIDLLGVPPDHLLNAGMYSHSYFNKTPSGGWRLKTSKEFWGWDRPHVDYRTYKLSSLDELETVSLPNLDMVGADEKKECLDLLKAMLQIDPKERITPTEVLNHPFITRGSVQHSSDQSPVRHLSNCSPPQHRVIMVKPAPPDCCRPLDEDDDEPQSESCSVQKLEEPSENSPVGDLREDESDCSPSLFILKDCDSELTEEKKRKQKKKKKNCFKRFFSWKTFCSCVSVNDDYSV